MTVNTVTSLHACLWLAWLFTNLCCPFAVLAQPTLTKSSSAIVCEREFVEYRCDATGSTTVRWIVEPFIPASGVGNVLFTNNAADNGVLRWRANDRIQIRQESASPFITAMTIFGTITDSAIVICLSSEGNNSMEYDPGGKRHFGGQYHRVK